MPRRILAALLAAAFLGGASLAGAQPARAQSDSDTLTISQGVDADTLDPLTTPVTTTDNITFQIFDGLLAHDPHGKLLPALATSWKQISPDKWEFKLRHGVTFSNGDPFTSADVKFTVEKVLDPAFKSQKRNRVSTISEVLTPDPYTVIYVTKQPSAIMPGRPYDLRIVDAKYWKEHGDAYMADHPMGTGAYVLKEWRKDDRIVLTARKGYWGGDAAVKTVIFKPMPEAASRVAALQTGDTDIITNVPTQNAEQIANGRTTKLGTVRSDRVLFIAFNTQKPGIQQNVYFRQALNYAVDIPAIVKTVLKGHAYPLQNGPIPPGFVGYDPKLPSYSYDPAKAKELLKKAGVTGPLNLTLWSPSGRYNMDKEVAEAVAGQLSAVGVNATVRTQEWTNYVGAVVHKTMVPMYLLGWGNDTYDADDTLSSLFTSTYPISTWGTPETDKMIAEARVETDPTKRAALYAKVLSVVHEQAPWLFLFEYQDLYGINKRVDFQPRTDELIICHDIAWAK
ncbi:MAG TPA: ABC transporter substrate-binding protein [Candidatus Dormibacteraeota bacterium]|nr:ABC transporter substrate-binding protein [Candidatus Dormibacteraeota bacterium]